MTILALGIAAFFTGFLLSSLINLNNHYWDRRHGWLSRSR